MLKFPARTALATLALAGATGLVAQTAGQPDPSADSLLTRRYLLGDWGGKRTELADKGYTFTFNYTADTQRNVSGGLDRETAFFGRARFILDVDLQKAAGINGGRFFISALSQDGDLLSNTAGSYTPVSSIAGDDTTRLDQVYYQHTLADGKFWVRVGQVAGVDEFGAQPYGGYFMNNQLGYTTSQEFNTLLPFNAGAQPGIIVRVGAPNDGLYAKAGVFSGRANVFNTDEHGIKFGIDSSNTVWAGEVGYRYGYERGRPGDVRIGGHYNSGKFNRVDTGARIDDNYVVYAMANQTVWQDENDPRRGIDLGVTAFFAPSNRSQTDTELLFSAAYRGIIESRPYDVLALGVVLNSFGGEASDASVLAGNGSLGEEYVVELTYKAQLTPWLMVQPDIQYVANPGGRGSRKDLWVVGLRSSFDF